MAIGDDFTVNAAGDIRADSPAATYTVLELHRWLQDLADNQETAAGADDIVDITSLTPSERSTDQIITLLNGYNINDATAEWFYGGSIKQGSGATEEIYYGLQILGSVNTSSTQIQIVQDGALYDGDAPFWGTQASPLNPDTAIGAMAQFLVKARVNGMDIDGRRARIQIRNYGDSYAFFNVLFNEGVTVAAVSSVNDPQNNTAQGTVTAYTHVTNTEGYQLIDIGDGNGNQPYYSKWTYGADTSGDQLRGVWEFCKDLTSTGTAKTIHGLDGELFLGITHTYAYDNLSGTFTEDETVVWGTDITYGSLTGGTFTVGNYILFSGGAAGKIVYDNGTTACKVALEDLTVGIAASETMTEYNKSTGATGVTATVSTATNDDLGGGQGILLANNTTDSDHHIQLWTGVAPVNNLQVRGISSAATADVNVTVTAQTVGPMFLGSYVGTLIGAFGLGVDAGDLTSSDSVIDLDGDTNTPPNNVTWTLSGLVVGDRVLVGPKAGGDDFNFAQMTLSTTLSGATETAIVVGSIPANTPSSGTLRVTLDDGRIRYQAYSSYTGSTFTIPSTDYSGSNQATAGVDVMVSYLDLAATGTSEAFTTVYSSGPLALWVRVRDGGATPIKTYEAASSLGPTGGSATASRISDA